MQNSRGSRRHHAPLYDWSLRRVEKNKRKILCVKKWSEYESELTTFSAARDGTGPAMAHALGDVAAGREEAGQLKAVRRVK